MARELPVELLLLVFQYLEPESLLQCASVSKRWRRHATSEPVWRKFVLSKYTVSSTWMPSPHDIGCLTYYKLRAAMDNEVEALVHVIADLFTLGHDYIPWREELVTLGWPALDKLDAIERDLVRLLPPPGARLNAAELFQAVKNSNIASCANAASRAILRYEATHYLLSTDFHKVKARDDPCAGCFDLLAALDVFSTRGLWAYLAHARPVDCRSLPFGLPYASHHRDLLRDAFKVAQDEVLDRCNQTSLDYLSLPALVDNLWGVFCDDSKRPVTPDHSEQHFLGDYLFMAFVATQLERDQISQHFARNDPLDVRPEKGGPCAAALVTYCAMVRMARPGTAAWLFRRSFHPDTDWKTFWLCAEYCGETVFIPLTTDRVGTQRSLTDAEFRTLCGDALHSKVLALPDWGCDDVSSILDYFCIEMVRVGAAARDSDLEAPAHLMRFICPLLKRRAFGQERPPLDHGMSVRLSQLVVMTFPYDISHLTKVVLRHEDCTYGTRKAVESIACFTRLCFKGQRGHCQMSTGKDFRVDDVDAYSRHLRANLGTSMAELANEHGWELVEGDEQRREEEEPRRGDGRRETLL